MPQDPDERSGRRPGEHAQDELAAMQVRTDLAPDLAEHLGLDPEEDDVRALDGIDVGRGRPDAVFAFELFPSLLPRMGGDDLARIDQLAAEQPGDHRLRHHAGADGRDHGFRQGGHRAEYSREARPDGLGSADVSARGDHPVATAEPRRKNRPVVVTSATANPARVSAASSSAGS